MVFPSPEIKTSTDSTDCNLHNNFPTFKWYEFHLDALLTSFSQTCPGFSVSAVQVFWKHCGKRRNGSYLAQCFLSIWRMFYHFHRIWNCCVWTVSVWMSLKGVILERVKWYEFHLDTILLSLSQTSPGFNMSAVQVFWKHCGKRGNCS